MQLSHSEFFAIAGVVLSLLRYATYLWAIFRGTTKPHALTWLGAALMGGTVYVIQFLDQAGPTVWVTGVVTGFCTLIGLIAMVRGEPNITRSDWMSFVLALLVIPVWLLMKQPTVAILLVILVELLIYYPTVRKSYDKPWDEDAFSWMISAMRWLFASLAVTHMTISSLLYPVFIFACEIGFVGFLLWRRRALSQTA